MLIYKNVMCMCARGIMGVDGYAGMAWGWIYVHLLRVKFCHIIMLCGREINV